MIDKDKIELLARAVIADLGADQHSHHLMGDRPMSAAMAGAGGVRVNLELSGMVRNMVKELWLDNAAITQRVQQEIEAQTRELDLDQLVTDAVRTAVVEARRNLSATVQRHVDKLVQREVEDRLGTLPRDIARRVTAAVTEASYPAREGVTYGLASRPAKQRKPRAGKRTSS